MYKRIKMATKEIPPTIRIICREASSKKDNTAMIKREMANAKKKAIFLDVVSIS